MNGKEGRLTKVKDRDKPFTQKCMSAAERTSTALVFIPDLFRVVQYLSNNRDKRFATKCRKILLNTVGQVIFPDSSKPKPVKLSGIGKD